MSYRETEIKLPIEDLARAQPLLDSLGATLQEARHLEDNLVFDTVEKRLRTSGKLLRLRVTEKGGGESGILTFKGKARISDDVKDREEIECSVSNPDRLIRILSELRYEISFRYQKYRTVYGFPQIDLDVCVDETPIGNYYELEGDIEQIHVQAERLGFRRNQYITDSYAGLYLKWCNRHNIQPTQMIFP